MVARTATMSPRSTSCTSPRARAEIIALIFNQVMLELIVEHQAGIPVLMKPLSGHSSAGKEFGYIVHAPIAPLQTTYGTTYLVAYSAL